MVCYFAMNPCTISLSDICLDGITCNYTTMFCGADDDVDHTTIPLGIEIVLPGNIAEHAIAAFNSRKVTPAIFNDVLTLCDYLGVDDTPQFMLACIVFDERPSEAYALAPQHSRHYQKLYEDIRSLDDDWCVNPLMVGAALGCVAWIEHYKCYDTPIWEAAAAAGQLACLKMMHSRPHHDDSTHFNASFLKSCANGHLEVSKWLLLTDPNIRINAHAFYQSCQNGHFKIVEWLLSLNAGINVRAHDDYAFRLSCQNGHLEVAKLLWSLDRTVVAANERAFHYSCQNGHLEVAKWLWSFDQTIAARADRDWTFRRTCANGHLEVAQWLVSLGNNIDVRSSNDFAFKHSHANGHSKMAAWLLMLGRIEDK